MSDDQWFGVARRAGVAEIEDHLSALCEVMRRLIVGSAERPAAGPAVQREVFERPLQPRYARFANCLEQATSANFYKVAGRFTRAFPDLEAEGFEWIDAGRGHRRRAQPGLAARRLRAVRDRLAARCAGLGLDSGTQVDSVALPPEVTHVLPRYVQQHWARIEREQRGERRTRTDQGSHLMAGPVGSTTSTRAPSPKTRPRPRRGSS